ncbi:MAG: SLC13 family permease [Planctomycetes bacterium]|nr:SLC13 family permease [Planctomycetota bacterium]
MMQDQIWALLILAATVVLFFWGRWRHDVVALASLLACVMAGLVPAGEAFQGFGHPAVVTVACVLVLSWGLQTTGAVDALAQRLLPQTAGRTGTLAALVGLGAVLSAFMNNVGALALLMPVAIQLAAKHGLEPGRALMPLAFGTMLGGMTTLIGTPPNLIVSAFRAGTGAGSFAMFDFTPVGLAVAGAGIAFVALLGWRLVPARDPKGAATFDTATYLTEARVTRDGKAAGKTLREVEGLLEEIDAQVVGMVHDTFRVATPAPGQRLEAGDILVIEAEPEALASMLSSLGLKLEEHVPLASAGEGGKGPKGKARPAAEGRTAEDTAAEPADRRGRTTDEIVLQEMVAMPASPLIGRSATDVRLRTHHGLNLLAIARQGRRSIRRLRSTRIREGDVLLLQGAPDSLSGFAADFGCVPLAPRAIRIPDKGKTAVAVIVMALAVVGAAFGLLPAAISFAAGVLVLMALRVVPVGRVYGAVDWPVIVMLAALIPVAGTMATTGVADVLARLVLDSIGPGRPVLVLVAILVITMTLSDFMNNAATAAVMCPIAISAATQVGASADPFLMAVAIGSSCAFLTPIGHQNNTLILGPGGFRFGDYWRLGLGMELLVVAVGVPMLLLVWPLGH